MKEKRKHTRLSIEIDTEVKLQDGNIFKGHTKNISFSGILAEISDSEKINTENLCNLTLLLNSELREPSIEFNCRVIRKQDSNVGFKFISIIDVEGYDHFKNLMISNSKEPEKLIQELKTNPGIIVEPDK